MEWKREGVHLHPHPHQVGLNLPSWWLCQKVAIASLFVLVCDFSDGNLPVYKSYMYWAFAWDCFPDDYSTCIPFWACADGKSDCFPDGNPTYSMLNMRSWRMNSFPDGNPTYSILSMRKWDRRLLPWWKFYAFHSEHAQMQCRARLVSLMEIPRIPFWACAHWDRRLLPWWKFCKFHAEHAQMQSKTGFPWWKFY